MAGRSMFVPFLLFGHSLLATGLANPGDPPKLRDLPCKRGLNGFSRNFLTANMERSEGSCDPNGVCYWSGEAPFCGGSCPDGYEECGRDDCGEGGGILRSEWGLLLERRS